MKRVVTHIFKVENYFADICASRASRAYEQSWWNTLPPDLTFIAYRDHVTFFLIDLSTDSLVMHSFSFF